MTKKTAIILIVVVFVASGFFYKQLFKPQAQTSSIQTSQSTNTQNIPEQPSSKPESKNSLDLSNQGLEKLPMYILDQANLEELDISSNKLTGALPAEIRKLQKLKVLNASDNLMTGIPAEVGQLSNLEVLDFSNNKITGLPYELGNLKKLKVLNLSGNDYAKQDLEIIKKGLPADVKLIL